ncbi:14-3-3 domain-containing protein [Favolaschia claudopus]|uniref:14-3-3 domain-containing protein n=1 Tax=Favolaschia claudopus TaxID=2862362 RepID=A0AAW0BKV6_9AGAR
MVESMKQVVSFGGELSPHERNLLSAAYKMTADSRRLSWKTVSTIEKKEHSSRPTQLSLVSRCREKIEQELIHGCEEILELLTQQLIPAAIPSEAQVFYLKMRGDYYRYLAEFLDIDRQGRNLAQRSLEAYTSAMAIASDKLSAANPVRLGLALNFAVYYKEIANSRSLACDIASQAVEDAMRIHGVLDETESGCAALPIRLLQDNLSLWRLDMPA